MSLSDDIRLTGDPVLEEVCEPVGEITDEVRELAQTMLDTMYEAEGWARRAAGGREEASRRHRRRLGRG